MPPPTAESDGRPPFMVTLGLLPPYTVEDVQMAYRSKALVLHPDRGGDPALFRELHEAYERGLEYAEFHGSRRRWLGARVEEYLQREELIQAIHDRGGSVDVEDPDWLRRDLGEDFAQLMYRIVGVHLTGPKIGDDAIDFLVREQKSLPSLFHLDLAHSRIGDQGLLRLRVFTTLRRLDLRGTPISNRGLQLLIALPYLQWLHLGGTRVSWWGRLRLRRSFPQVEVLSGSEEVLSAEW